MMVRPGDFVFNPMWAVGGGVAVSEIAGAVSPAYRVYEPCPRLLPRYLHYFMRLPAVIEQFNLVVRGLTTFDRSVTREDFELMPVLVPPLAEQRVIADFLDRETSRIDALVTAKRRMTEAVAARFEAFRSRVVSEGVAPVPERETGHLFFPSIPTTWELRSLDVVVEADRPIVYGIVQPGPDVTDGVLYVKTGDLPSLDIGRMSRTSPEIALAYRRAALREGDIVVAMRASIGTCARVPRWLHGGNLTQGTARVAPGHGVNPAWLMHALQSQPMMEQMLYRSVGTTYLTLNIADLRKVALPVPPATIQNEIAQLLDEAQERKCEMAAALTRQIDLLVERRQALITAAVTGELDVGVAA